MTKLRTLFMKSLKQKIAALGFLPLKQHFTENISNISGLRRGDTWLRRQMVRSCNWDTDSYSCASSCVLPVWSVLVLLQEGLKTDYLLYERMSRDFNLGKLHRAQGWIHNQTPWTTWVKSQGALDISILNKAQKRTE